MAANPDWLRALLEDENFLKYHAYFDTFKHNHKAQSTVALARMGASEERVKQHCHAQNTRSGLVPFNKDEPLTQQTEVDSLKSENIQDYKGANVGYYRVLKHYRDLYETKYGKDLKKLIQGEFPSIADGPLVSAFHGVIQLGYGYTAGSVSLILEGLGYCMAQYSPYEPKDKSKLTNLSAFGKGQKDILDTLKEIREDKKMLEDIAKFSDTESYKKKCPDNFFDWYSLATINHFSDRFLQMTDELKLPEFFDASKQDMGQLVKLVKWLEDMAAIVFVKSELRNQFFLLHGITSTWSLRQIIELLSYQDALHIIRAHICGYLMTYTGVKAPQLNRTPEDYWSGDKVDKAAWDLVLRDVKAKDFEDHVFKVTQVLWEKWMDAPESPHAKMYIAGARMAIDLDYNLSPFPGDFTFPNVLH